MNCWLRLILTSIMNSVSTTRRWQRYILTAVALTLPVLRCDLSIKWISIGTLAVIQLAIIHLDSTIPWIPWILWIPPVPGIQWNLWYLLIPMNLGIHGIQWNLWNPWIGGVGTVLVRLLCNLCLFFFFFTNMHLWFWGKVIDLVWIRKRFPWQSI